MQLDLHVQERMFGSIVSNLECFKDIIVNYEIYSDSDEKDRSESSPALVKRKKIGEDKNDIYSYTFTVRSIDFRTDERFHNDSMRYRFELRYGSFLRDMGIDVTDRNIFICIILHELGHVEYTQLFFKNGSNVIGKVKQYKMNERMAVMNFGDDVVNTPIHKYGLTLEYLCISEELFCELFAIRHIKRAVELTKDIPWNDEVLN